MYLTDEELGMLNGTEGPAVQKSMQVLTALGDAFGAERMIPICSAHLPGLSIEVAGEAGVHFLAEMKDKGGKFRVYTTTNICSIDFEEWESIGILPEDHELQQRMSVQSHAMGALELHSCIPYELGHIPRLSDHVAWGESSAVMYANSVLGARTNKEGGPSALAAAITGRVPAYGMHLDENRYAKVVINIKTDLKNMTDYGTLGYFGGKNSKNGIVAFTGMDEHVSNEELKYLAASISSAGTAAMFHAVGITPEASTLEKALGGKEPELTVDFTEADKNKLAEYLDREKGEALDWVVIGCPHVGNAELKELAEALKGKRIAGNVEFWILCSAMGKAFAESNGYKAVIEAAGARLVQDTCPVVMTMESLRNIGRKTLATNSAKLVNCMPGEGFLIHYGDINTLVKAAEKGRWEK